MPGTSNVLPQAYRTHSISSAYLTKSSPETTVIRSGPSVPNRYSPVSTTPTVARLPLRSNPTLWTPPSKYVLCLSIRAACSDAARAASELDGGLTPPLCFVA